MYSNETKVTFNFVGAENLIVNTLFESFTERMRLYVHSIPKLGNKLLVVKCLLKKES